MNRNLAKFSDKTFDVLIIGGGIYGVTAAWDAAQRGLSVAIVEKNDFGGATSANSLKIIHGGLRYLQSFDIARMRESIFERKVLMRIAPHLVHPLPCVMPTYGHLLKGKEALSIAMLLNDAVSFDRNFEMDKQKHLPNGKILSKEETLRLLPGYQHPKFTGGAMWYDAQMINSERLTFSFLHSAVEVGARAANYAQAENLLQEDGRVVGATVKDLLTNERYDINAKLVINTCGPFVDTVLQSINNRKRKAPYFLPSTAMNLVTRQFIPKVAAGLRGKFEFPEKDGSITKGYRVYFTAPWRGTTIVGTQHRPYFGKIEDFKVTEEYIQEFLDGINDAFPAAKLKFSDVKFVMAGFLPMSPERKPGMDVLLQKHYNIIDHSTDDDLDGLISVIGVKYTTARDVSEKTINLAFKKLGKEIVPSQTAELPLFGGDITDFTQFLKQETEKHSNKFEQEIIERLIHTYGSEYSELFKYMTDNHAIADNIFITSGEILFALKNEMVCHLPDLVFRRTDLGTAGYPGDKVVEIVADIAAKELGWDDNRKKAEIEMVKKAYEPLLL